MDKAYRYLLLIIATVGFIWLRSGVGKLLQEKFISGMSSTLQKFAGSNPYPWYKQFLENVAIPNSEIFGQLTLWGEILTGLALVLLPLYCIFKPASRTLALLLTGGLIGGMLMNLNYWLAAGYMSPSTESVNLLMLAIEFIGLIYVLRLKT